MSVDRLLELPVHTPSGLFSPGSGCRNQGFSTVRWPKNSMQRLGDCWRICCCSHIVTNESVSNRTSHSLHTAKQQPHLHFRVEGIAREFKPDLIIALWKHKYTSTATVYIYGRLKVINGRRFSVLNERQILKKSQFESGKSSRFCF